jgi:hypothetical protein
LVCNACLCGNFLSPERLRADSDQQKSEKEKTEKLIFVHCAVTVEGGEVEATLILIAFPGIFFKRKSASCPFCLFCGFNFYLKINFNYFREIIKNML